jgi:hypothetical protein
VFFFLKNSNPKLLKNQSNPVFSEPIVIIMTVITMFLAMLVAALAIGNALLQMVSTEKKQNNKLEAKPFLGFSEDQLTEQNNNLSNSFEDDRLAIIEAKFAALNNKILMAHDRLQRIETMLLESLNKPALQAPVQNQPVSAISGKLDKLWDFKSNTEIELAAMKDALREKGILKPLAEKKQKIQTEEISDAELEEIDKRAHDIVFHSTTKNKA